MCRSESGDTWTRIFRVVILSWIALALPGDARAGQELCQPEFSVKNYLNWYLKKDILEMKNIAEMESILEMLTCDLELLSRLDALAKDTPQAYLQGEAEKLLQTIVQEYATRERKKRATGARISNSPYLFDYLLPNVKYKVLEIRDTVPSITSITRRIDKEVFVELTYQNRDLAPIASDGSARRVKKLVVAVTLVAADSAKLKIVRWFIDTCRPLSVGMEFF